MIHARAVPQAEASSIGLAASSSSPADGLRRRLVVCGGLTLALLVAGRMVPPPSGGSGGGAATVAPIAIVAVGVVVALWGAAPIHRVARRDLRHAVVSADALASAAVLAALGLALGTLALSAAGGGSPGLPAVPLPSVELGPLSLPGPGTAVLSLAPDIVVPITAASLAVRYLRLTVESPSPGVTPTGSGSEMWPSSATSRSQNQWGYGVAGGTAGGWMAGVGMVAAAGALGFWWAVAGPAAGTAAAVTVLVAAAPCPVRLARSAALQAAGSAADHLGIAVRDPSVLTRPSRLDVAVVDCTGTLTVGIPQLRRLAVTTDDVAPERALRIMGSLLARADDPVARAVVAACHDHHLTLSSVEVQVDSGRHGVRGVVDGMLATVGHEHFLRRWRLTVPPALEPLCAGAEAEGHHAVLAGWEGQARVVVVVADAVRPTAVAAVEVLRDARVRPVVLSSDTRSVVEAVAELVGIDQVAAELDAADKAEVVRRYRRKGRRVLVLADPVEDAEALDVADLGLVAPSPSRLRSAEPADVDTDIDEDEDGDTVAPVVPKIIVIGRTVEDDPEPSPTPPLLPPDPGHAEVRRGDLWTVVDAVRLWRLTRRTIRVNRLVAGVVPAVGIPLALLGMLDPMLACAATVLSASAIVLHSQRLRRVTSARPPEHRRRAPFAPATDNPGDVDVPEHTPVTA